jgi:acyl-CoA thioester hydrolase
MERGRSELLRDLDVHQRALLEGPSGGGVFFVVRAMDIGFIKPALMDDLLTVETSVKEIGGASLTLLQRVMRDTTTLAEATVRVVCVENGRARRLPADVRDKFLAALAKVTKA